MRNFIEQNDFIDEDILKDSRKKLIENINSSIKKIIDCIE